MPRVVAVPGHVGERELAVTGAEAERLRLRADAAQALVEDRILFFVEDGRWRAQEHRGRVDRRTPGALLRHADRDQPVWLGHRLFLLGPALGPLLVRGLGLQLEVRVSDLPVD